MSTVLWEYPGKFIVYGIEAIKRAFNLWDYFIYQVMTEWKQLPEFMKFGSNNTWWHNVLLVAFYGAIYLAAAAFLWYVIGWPVKKLAKHMGRHRCRMMPAGVIIWVLACYVVDLEMGTRVPTSPYDCAVTFYGWIGYFIYYLIKVKWRVIYFPIISLVGYVYFLICFSYALLPIVIFLVFASLLGSLQAASTPSDAKYVCRQCGRKYSQGGICPYCNEEVT